MTFQAIEEVTTDRFAEALATDLSGVFERVVLAYQDRLYGFALRMTGDPRDAEEVAQDVFVRAYRALATYDADRIRSLALRPWLYRITLNVTRNRVRGKRIQMLPLDGPEEVRWEVADDERHRPEVTALRAERDAELGALVATLPVRYRAAVTLRHVDGLGYDEIAEVLERPIGTVKSDVHRGLRLLRAAIERQGMGARR